MNIELKILTEKDWKAYRDLRINSLIKAPYAFSDSHEDEALRTTKSYLNDLQIMGSPPEQFILGAFVEQNQLIGFVKFRRDRRTKARHKSMLHTMFVDPNYQKQGIGETMMRELLRRAKQMAGLEQIHLWALHSAKHPSAANFYAKCGFEKQGPFVRQDLKVGDTYIDAEYMVLYLEK